ncbi:MAG: hypothetical protein ACM359_13985 [Bacillota bacterium]
MSVEQGRDEGLRRKEIGIALAARRKTHRIKRGQLDFLNAGMARFDRTCRASDIARNRAIKYSDGGNWVGAAIRFLVKAKLIIKLGYDISPRPSRRGSDERIWVIADEERVNLFRQELEAWLAANPLPPDPQGDGGSSPCPASLPLNTPSTIPAAVATEKGGKS